MIVRQYSHLIPIHSTVIRLRKSQLITASRMIIDILFFHGSSINILNIMSGYALCQHKC